MATLSHLVETIAAVEGIDPATVALIARNIREADLISTGGRGTSAARMTLTDAANLLIGVNATRVAAEAVDAVRAYRDLQAYEFHSLSDPSPESSLGRLGDTIEQLIEASGAGKLPDPFFEKGISLDMEETFSRGDVHIELKFRTLSPAASLRMWLLPGSDVVDPATPAEWLYVKPPDISVLFSPTRQRRSSTNRKNITGDRIEETTIGYRTLHAVGKLISVQT
jgi:hypothetical protein